MRHKSVLFILLGIIALATFTVSAQEDASKKKYELAIGIATEVGQQKIILNTKNGMLDAVIGKTTSYFRLPPDNLKLSAATESQLADITKNDKVLVTGEFSEDRKTIYTVKVYLVKGSDIAAQQEKQRKEWQTRGISGRVTEVDATAKTITVEVRTLVGDTSILKLTPKSDVKYLRYSSESVKYSDAVISEFSVIAKDELSQALGETREDGTTFTAEEVLTGAFVTVAGSVKSIDTEKNEVTISDLKTKKDVTISVKNTSLLKKFPEEVAQRMARMMMFRKMSGGSGVRPPNAGNRGGNRPAGRPAGQRAGRGEGRGNGQGRRGGRGRMDINQMLNRFPSIVVSDLKAGDMIAVSSPKVKEGDNLTAIKLLAGVEPFVQVAAASSGRSRRSGRGGVSGGLNIPGLGGGDF